MVAFGLSSQPQQPPEPLAQDCEDEPVTLVKLSATRPLYDAEPARVISSRLLPLARAKTVLRTWVADQPARQVDRVCCSQLIAATMLASMVA